MKEKKRQTNKEEKRERDIKKVSKTISNGDGERK